MDEEQLHQTAFVAYLALSKPEYAEHLRDGGCGHAQVSESQQEEKQKHGLVQGALNGDGEKNGTVAHHRDEVHGGEGDRYPFVLVLHPRNALKNEERRVACAVTRHYGGTVVKYLKAETKKLLVL